MTLVTLGNSKLGEMFEGQASTGKVKNGMVCKAILASYALIYAEYLLLLMILS
jgi:hypothetical protein